MDDQKVSFNKNNWESNGAYILFYKNTVSGLDDDDGGEVLRPRTPSTPKKTQKDKRTPINNEIESSRKFLNKKRKFKKIKATTIGNGKDFSCGDKFVKVGYRGIFCGNLFGNGLSTMGGVGAINRLIFYNMIFFGLILLFFMY